MLAVCSVILGAHGAVVGIIPGLGGLGLVLGVIGAALGVPVLHAGAGTTSRRYVRLGVVLSLVAVVTAGLNLYL